MTRYNITHSPALEGCRDRMTALEAENARLREALTGLYQALRERHHGRMPDDVRIAYEQAAAVLAGEARDEAAELRAALERIADWPDGGNPYGQANIKRFAVDTLRRLAGGEAERHGS